MRAQQILPRLAREQPPAIGKVATGKLPNLCELPHTVRRRDQPPPGAHDARELRQSAVQVRHVIEHEVRDRDVELPVAERELLDITEAGIDPRADVSSTILGDWSIAMTSTPACASRSANSPRPQPTSSTRRGSAAITSSNAMSSGC